MSPVRQISREQMLAFRLAAHHLAQRRPLDALLDVAAACGVRNTPPGSAALALQARLANLRPADVEQALERDRTLVEVLGPRLSPYLVPARDLAVFTLGALPREEASARAALASLTPMLREAGLAALAALEQAAEAARAELQDGPLARGALSAALTRRLPEPLSRWCSACGSRHVGESLFRLLGVQGVFVVARSGKRSCYVRADQWLAAAPDADSRAGQRLASGPDADPRAARAELLRRFLRCYGPATAGDFAAWVGLSAAEAGRAWELVADQLVPIDLEGRRAWLPADDLTRLENPPQPAGVRLLPPYDAYLDQRDRATLLPDQALHPRVWRAIGNPGALLADGELVGLWRPQKQGRRLRITVEAFRPLARSVQAELEAEAARLAPFRDCTTVEVRVAEANAPSLPGRGAGEGVSGAWSAAEPSPQPSPRERGSRTGSPQPASSGSASLAVELADPEPLRASPGAGGERSAGDEIA